MSRRTLGFAAAGLIGAALRLQAQEIEFQGSTRGCFVATGGTPICPTMGLSAVDKYLSFITGNFDQWTAGGVAAFDLGTVSLGKTPADYVGDVFKLGINFSLPNNVIPDAVYNAILSGNVTTNADGAVDISFDPSGVATQTFAFNGPDYSGTFDLMVFNQSVSAGTLESGSPVALSAFVQTNVTATPEPATVTLFATGLFGLVPLARLRRRATRGEDS